MTWSLAGILIGCALIVAGVAFIFWPAALIAAGVAFLWLLTDDGSTDAEDRALPPSR